MQVNIHEAKTHFSKLLHAVESGEQVVIARDGKPIARLVPIREEPDREPGSARGQFLLPDAFFQPLPEDILQGFEP